MNQKELYRNINQQRWQHQLGCLFIFFLLIQASCQSDTSLDFKFEKEGRIVLIGGNLYSRMMNYGYFETTLHQRFPNQKLYIRNMCDGGDTPGFRPHSGRPNPWAFEGAKEFQSEYANDSRSEGKFGMPDEWLKQHRPDYLLAFFGYSESFQGADYVATFKEELRAFITHTNAQKYNGSNTPKLILVTPIAFEDLSDQYNLPNGEVENINLSLYANAIIEVAQENEVAVIDAFTPSKKWMEGSEEMTIDGFQLNENGYMRFSNFLAQQLTGEKEKNIDRDDLLAAVQEKNWMWHQDYKIPNGVHVYGRRFNPFGPQNYPFERKKIREMTANRDSAIWSVLQGETFDVSLADQNTAILPEVPTNYNIKPNSGNGSERYLYGDEAVKKISVPKGYKVELFASEQEFESLANPCQLSFDDKGRLWVATMPSYPHYKPGDAKPNDKLIILEDTNNDGKADKETIFADGLHVPVGFEFAPDGVYVSQGTNLVLLKDTDGDDKADQKEIILSGFDDHDTHHTVSAFCADPSGAIYMAEGLFLHTSVETPYGTVRAANGGFYRYAPQQKKLERTSSIAIPNPWGIAFDEWGQPFFSETSGPPIRWMLPSTIKPRYGQFNPKAKDLIKPDDQVRPVSGLEFVSSRHFPDDVQGDLLFCNSIGFLGMKQHEMNEDTIGYTSDHRLDLMSGSDPNFRPVDMEFAPDGSLYVVDWHNVLIGHMQHNARDPLRDHVHGRIYRVTYPSRPLVPIAKVADASIPELLENLKLPEYRTRYRSRRVLRGKDANQVASSLKSWVADLDVSDPNYEHHLVEALWVSWGISKIDETLLRQVLKAKDHRARAAAIRVIRYNALHLKDHADLLKVATNDEHGRVKMEALVAASWLSPEIGNEIIDEIERSGFEVDRNKVIAMARAHLNNRNLEDKSKGVLLSNHLEGPEFGIYRKGFEIYHKDGYCVTCHQANGNGLKSSGFPPLSQTDWVTGDEERLIKIILKGIYGPIKVNGVDYPGQVPMTPYEQLLNDEEIAAIATYIRNDFKNKASVVTPETVAKVRVEVADKKGFYLASELE